MFKEWTGQIRMDRTDIKSRFTLSGSAFHQKIIKKYLRGKGISPRFPLLNFYENRGCFLPKKISMNILFKLQLINQSIEYNQNIASFLTAKDIHARKGKISWISFENTLQQMEILRHNQSLNRIPAITFLKYLVFRAGNRTTEPDIILKPLFLAVNAASYQQTNYTTLSENLAINQHLLNYGNVQIHNSQIFGVRINRELLNPARSSILTGKEGKYKPRSTFEHKSPGVLSQYNLLFNNTMLSLNRSFFKNLNRAANNFFIKNYYSSGYESFGFVQKGYAYKTSSESLHFRDQGHIETEIEQIKKIIIETKESVLEKPAPSFGEAEIKRYLDINRISDQVYQNLERTIRMERERRGM
jgi:hypothetical protein